MIRSCLLACALTLGFGASLHADDMARFHRVLDDADIRMQVEEMMKDQPKWVQLILEHGGVESPGARMTLEDQSYSYYRTCRPHECNMKKISMMIGDDGAIYMRVYGTTVDEQFFGGPSEKIKKVMRDLD